MICPKHTLTVLFTVNYDKPFPAGWTDTNWLLEPYTYQYENPGFQHNHDPPRNYSGRYNTDMIMEKTLAYLDAAVKEDEPFFIVSAPIAPHATVDISYNLFKTGSIEQEFATVHPPVPAARHAHLFPNEIVPRTPSFNPEEVSCARAIRCPTSTVWNDADKSGSPTASRGSLSFLVRIKRTSIGTITSTDSVCVPFSPWTR